MDVSAWVWYTLIAALAMAASVAHYRWREPAGSGRTLLAVLRGGALALLVLLLFDPVLPARARTDGPVVALVDASLSMSLVGEDGISGWDAAGALVAAADPDRIQIFGTAEGGTVPSLADAAPTLSGSRLAPALRGALDAGAGRIVIVTDGAVEDAADVRRMSAESGVPIEVHTVGAGTRVNLSLEEVDVPRWLEAGEPSAVRFAVARWGEAGDPSPESATVTLTRAGRELARTTVPVPAPGRTAVGELRFRPAPGSEGSVRLDVEVEPGGAVPDDDTRSVYVRIAEEPAGVALVSLRPDQEPRFLLPVLERALGLPVRGWIGLTGDRFVRVGSGPDAGAVTTAAAVRGAVGRAALVVVHGVDAAAPAWVRGSIAEAERVLVFPSDPAPPLPVATGPLREGDWYLAPEVPSSPVAPLLAGIEPGETPPLMALRTLAVPQGYWAPLLARLGRRGDSYPVAVLGAPPGRRVAIALGDGYWRWAFSGAEGRDVYTRFWSAISGWLMEESDAIERDLIRPVSRVVKRGDAVHWIAPRTADSVAITIHREPMPGEDGELRPVVDTTVVVEEARAITAALPSGHYRYAARGRVGEAMEGAFTVESYSSELTDVPMSLDAVAGGAGERAGPGERRPLRTMPLPYILVVGLLCAEWVLRRRWGLR